VKKKKKQIFRDFHDKGKFDLKVTTECGPTMKNGSTACSHIHM